MVYLKRLVCTWVGVNLVVVLGGLSRAQATIPGQNGKIAISWTTSITPATRTSVEMHTSSVLVGNLDSGFFSQVGTGGKDIVDGEPSWSADGKRLVFARSSAAAVGSDLFIVKEDGSGETRLTSFAGDESGPDWSPDGSQIAFTQGGKIAVINADGSNPRVVSDGLGGYSPSWSPDGKKILFVANGLGAVSGSFLVMNADGTGAHQVGSELGGTPSWSPDGKQILFTAAPSRDDPQRNIFVMNADGTGVQNLTNYTKVDFTSGMFTYSKGVRPMYDRPVWSPDGKQILFLRKNFNTSLDRDGNYISELWMMDANGDNQRQVVTIPSGGLDYSGVAWQTLNATPVRGDCNGVNCSDSPRLVVANEKKLTKVLKKPVAFSKAKLGVSGTLLNQSGQPIGNAVVDVLQKATLPGAEQVKVGEVKTDAKGVWKTTVAAGPSRSLQFAYRAYKNDKNYSVLSSVLSQRVRGSVSLKLPKRAKRGKKLVLEGSLAGGFVPAQGKVVELQVLYKKKYRVFKTIRTDAKGVFRLQFRFGNSYRPGAYRLRVNVRSEQAWPFLATTSKTRKIQVR